MQVDDSKLPVEHPKPVIPPGVKAVYTAPHLDTAARTATKAPTPKPTAAKKAAASTHVDTATRASGRKLLAETPGQVDVGIFWTGNAQKAVGGAAQMQAKIRAAVVATNAVYAASKLTARLRLVYMGAHFRRSNLPADMTRPLQSVYKFRWRSLLQQKLFAWHHACHATMHSAAFSREKPLSCAQATWRGTLQTASAMTWAPRWRPSRPTATRSWTTPSTCAAHPLTSIQLAWPHAC